MARAAKAYVLGEPFQSHRAAQRMTTAVNIYTERLRAALELAVAWGIRSRGFDAQTAHELGHWVDGGMKGEPPRYLLPTSVSEADDG